MLEPVQRHQPEADGNDPHGAGARSKEKSMSQFIELPDGSSRIEIVRLGDVEVDEYQRGHRSSADKVRDHFDERLLEVLTISRRLDRRMFLIDGLQRKTGLEARPEGAGEDTLVLARILEGLTVQDEVFLFEKLNKERVKVSAFDIFAAQLFAREVPAVALNRVVTSVDNLTIGPSHKKDVVGSVSLLWDIASWKDGLVILTETLLTLRAAYPNQDKQLHGVVVGGLARLLRELRTQGVYDKTWRGHEDLAHRLTAYKYSATAPMALSSALATSETGSGVGAGRVALPIFVGAWNKGRKSGGSGWINNGA